MYYGLTVNNVSRFNIYQGLWKVYKYVIFSKIANEKIYTQFDAKGQPTVYQL